MIFLFLLSFIPSLMPYSSEQSAFAEEYQEYYVPPQSCPEGTRPHRQILAKVDDSLLPRYVIDQGDTPSCSVHAAMVLLNSLFRYEQKKHQHDPSLIPDLSFVHGMFQYANHNAEMICGLEYSDKPVTFLMKAARGQNMRLDQAGVSVKAALRAHKALRSKLSSSEEVNAVCISRIFTPLVEPSRIEDIQAILTAAMAEPESSEVLRSSPIQALSPALFPHEVRLPSFQLETREYFESEQDRLDQIVEHFKSQNPVFPLLLATCYASRYGICGENAHAIALTQIDRVECRRESSEESAIVKVLYEATFHNSWGGVSHGPFDLAKMVKGMHQFDLGFTQIIPCSDSAAPMGCGQSILKKHPQSAILQHYVDAEDLEGLKQITEHNFNTVDKFGWSALHYAVALSHPDFVKTLASAGANLKLETSDEVTPLMLAINDDHSKMIQTLLSAGVELNVGNSKGIIPLQYAAEKGKVEAVRALLAARASRDMKNEFGWTALHIAAFKGYVDVVQELVAYGSDLNAKNSKGLTPLFVAAEAGKNNVVLTLMEAGADQNAADPDGGTPLHVAVAHGHSDVVKTLLDGGAYVNARTLEGKSALHIAAINGDFKTVRLLLSEGANVNAVMIEGLTPLIAAAVNGKQAAVEEILRSPQIQINLKFKEKTAAQWAVEKGYPEIAEMIRRK